MKMLIIPKDRAEKIRKTKFPYPHELNPIKGELDGKEVYFLNAELKDNPLFVKALEDFEASEIKDIETIEEKYFDSKNVEITEKEELTQVIERKVIDGKQVDEVVYEGIKYVWKDSDGNYIDPHIDLIPKTILTEISLFTKVINGVVYVWDSIIGWFTPTKTAVDAI